MAHSTIALTGASRTFHQFLDLPVELRAKTWEQSAKESWIWSTLEQHQVGNSWYNSPVLKVRGAASQLLHISPNFHAEILPILFEFATYDVPQYDEVAYPPLSNIVARIQHVSMSWSKFLEGTAGTIYRHLARLAKFKNFAVEVGTDNPNEQYIFTHKRTENEIKEELNAWSQDWGARSFAIRLLVTESKPFRWCYDRGQANLDWDAWARAMRMFSGLYMERVRQGNAFSMGFGHKRMPIGCPGKTTDYGCCEQHENAQFDHFAEVCLTISRSRLIF